jgi:hypothetical protein
MSSLSAYAQALSTPWAEDDLDTVNDEMSLSITGSVTGGTIGVDFEWNGSDIGIHQHLGYASAAPGGNTDDSGNGGLTSNDRRVNGIGDSGTRTYHFFHIDASAERYIHCVVEYASGLYRHFGFGELVKGGADWTGGEYAYGGYWDQGTSSIDTPLGAHSILLDSSASNASRAATIHVEGLQDAPSGCKWGVCGNIASPGTDSAANGRVSLFGGTRTGPYLSTFAAFAPSNLTGIVPMVPNHVFYRNTTPGTPRWFHLGVQPDVRLLNMKNFQAGDVITVGSEDWMIFPAARKQYLTSDSEESWNMGIAYRKT